MTKRRQQLGREGEDAAAEWYKTQGFTIVARNWRVKEGELDIICACGDVVVFAEVKTRSSTRFGLAAEAVTPTKQRKIRTLAMMWLAQCGRRYGTLRFDVVDADARGHLKVYEYAF